MSITDELRKWKGHIQTRLAPEAVLTLRAELNAIADRIDAEYEEVLGSKVARAISVGEDGTEFVSMPAKELSECYMELPKDAHDECIYVGDVMDGYGKTIEVMELRIGRSGWVIVSRDGSAYDDTSAFAHHKPPTVEDVLREMLYKAHIYDKREMELLPDLIAEYAAKLQLRSESE